jgi:hypothetical protein
MPKQTPAERRRTKYEIDVLREALFPHARTQAQVKRTAVTYLYDRLLAERIANTSKIAGNR